MSTFGLPPLDALQKPKKLNGFEPDLPGLTAPSAAAAGTAPFSAVPKPLATNAPLSPLAELTKPSAAPASAPLSSAPTTPQLPRPILGAAPRAIQHASDPALRALQSEYTPVKQGFATAESAFEQARTTRNNILGAVKPMVAFNPKLDMIPPQWAGTTPGGATALDTAQRQLSAAAEKRDSFVPALEKATAGFRDYTDRSQANLTLRAAGGVPTPIPVPATPATHPTVPARSPDRPGSSEGIPQSQVGASATAPLPTVRALNLGASPIFGGGGVVRDSLASNVTKGVPTYDNASIDKLNARNAVPGANGVQTQSFGGPTTAPLAMPTMPAQTQPNLAVNLPRPAQADPYYSRENNDQRKALLSDLGSQAFAAGLAQPSNGQRATLGGIRDAQASLVNEGGRLAGDIAGGNRDATAKYDLAGVDQQGQNQRALLQDTGETTRTGLTEAGANAREQLKSLAELTKPSTITDNDGYLQRVSGTNVAPVLDALGNKVQPLQNKIDRPDANTIVNAFTAQQKALADAAALTGKPADYSALQASPLGQAYQQVLPAGPPADHIAKLRANPHFAKFFDDRYGRGAAARYLKAGSQ